MTAEEKAKELIDKYKDIRWDIDPKTAKQGALIAVDEILDNGFDFIDDSEFWKQVKQEILKL